MDTNLLAPDTRRVWDFLQDQRTLAGFTLIGGTALTMRIGHRISEDLDFVCNASVLPRNELNALVRLLGQAGFDVQRDDDSDRYDEFLIAGMSLHDYQQNFIVDGVKLNIFAPNPDLAGLVEPSQNDRPVVATLLELFRTKALAAANRRMSRDALDLYILFRHHEFTVQEFAEAFHHSPGIHYPEKMAGQAFDNLCSRTISALDPGYETMMENPPSLDDLADFFANMREEYEVSAAKSAFESEGLSP